MSKTFGEGRITVNDRVDYATLLALWEARDQAVSADDLVARAIKRLTGIDTNTVRQTFNSLCVRLVFAGQLNITAFPDPAMPESDTPNVWSYAAEQAKSSLRVTNRLHQIVELDAVGQVVLQSLDGKRSAEAAAAAILAVLRERNAEIRDDSGTLITDDTAALELVRPMVQQQIAIFRAAHLLAA